MKVNFVRPSATKLALILSANRGSSSVTSPVMCDSLTARLSAPLAASPCTLASLLSPPSAARAFASSSVVRASPEIWATKVAIVIRNETNETRSRSMCVTFLSVAGPTRTHLIEYDDGAARKLLSLGNRFVRNVKRAALQRIFA